MYRKLTMRDKFEVNKTYRFPSDYSRTLFMQHNLSMGSFGVDVQMDEFTVERVHHSSVGKEVYIQYTRRGEKPLHGAYIMKEAISFLEVKVIPFRVGFTYQATPLSHEFTRTTYGQRLNQFLGVHPFKVLSITENVFGNQDACLVVIENHEGRRESVTLNLYDAYVFKQLDGPSLVEVRPDSPVPETGWYRFKSRNAMEQFIQTYPTNRYWAEKVFGMPAVLMKVSKRGVDCTFFMQNKIMINNKKFFEWFYSRGVDNKCPTVTIDSVTLTVSNEQQRLEAINLLEGIRYAS